MRLMKIGKRIKKYRKEKGLTQKELGDLIGRSEVSVRKYEADDVTPNIDITYNIAEVLEINRLDLLRDTPEQFIAKVSVKDTQSFKKLLGFIKDILVDERIDKSIRQEYYDKYLNEVEK